MAFPAFSAGPSFSQAARPVNRKPESVATIIPLYIFIDFSPIKIMETTDFGVQSRALVNNWQVLKPGA
jgi:hypothetical protein